MRSIAEAFPDARVLLALDQEQLAGFFLFIFRNLLSRDPRAVRRCVTHWAEPYPLEIRGAVIEAVMAAWESLDADGFLGEEPTTRPEASPPSRAIRLRA